MITRNRIYQEIVSDVIERYPNAYCSSIREAIPAAFPAANIYEQGYVNLPQYVTLNYDDNQQRVTYEVQVYSNKSGGRYTEAHGIMDVIISAFRRIGFICDFVNPIDNADDGTIYRLVGRFHSTTGFADELPTNENNEEE